MRRLVRRRAAGDATAVLEGPRTVSEALASGIEPSVVAVAESAAETPAIQAVLGRLAPSVEVLVLTDPAFESVAPAVSPQPMLAVVDRPQSELPQTLAQDDLVLVLAGVSDPGNTGTIIRIAEACAARCVVLTGGADPWAPKVVRASAGSVLRVPVVQAADAGAALGALRLGSARGRKRPRSPGSRLGVARPRPVSAFTGGPPGSDSHGGRH